MKTVKSGSGCGSMSAKKRALWMMIAPALLCAPALGGNLTWDRGGASPTKPADGGGNWDTSSLFWSNGATDGVWVNDGTGVAAFGDANGAAGTVTINVPTINAAGLAFSAAGSGNYIIAATSGDTLTLTGGANITVATGVTPTISGVITGTAGLNYTGTGTASLVLSGINTYSGNTSVNSGTLTTSANTSLGTSNITIASGGEVITNAGAVAANNFTISGTGISGASNGSLVVHGTVAGNITLNGNARIGGIGFSDTFSGNIGGTGNLEFFSAASGNSTFSLTNTANAWSGNTTVTNTETANTANGTILKLGASNVLPVGSSLTLNAVGSGLAELDMAGHSGTVAGLYSTGVAGKDEIINSSSGSGTLTISTNADAVFAGVVGGGAGTGAIGLSKAGTGMQTLAGANVYTGNTTINGGTLAITGSLVATGNVTVNANGTLAGTGSVGNVLLNNAAAAINPGAIGAESIGTLTMVSLTDSSGDMQFDLSTPTNSDKITVGGAASLNSASAINVTGFAPGTYTLLTAGSITGTLPTLSGMGPAGSRPANFVYDASSWDPNLNPTATSIVVDVSGGAASLVWAGGVGGFTANGADGTTWDALQSGSDQNWNNNGTQDYFYNGDSVTFNDAGSPNYNVTLTSTVAPGPVTFNSSGNYTISGGGSIGGVTSLVQNGSGSVTLATSNTYSGGTTITNGTLNANASSATGTGNITLNGPGQLNINNAAFGSGALIINGGTLDNTSGADITVSTNNIQTWAGNFTFAGSSNLNLGTGAVTLTTSPTVSVAQNTLTVGGSIGGAFGLTKAGGGTLMLSGANTYTGTTTISSGTIVATNSGSLGSTGGAGVVINGGTLDVGGAATANSIQFSATNANGLSFTIAGTGANGVGAVTNSNANLGQFNTFRGSNVTLSADALISGNRIDIGRDGNVTSTLDLGSHTLTLSMSGSAPMFGVENHGIVDGNGNIVVAAGTLDIEQNASVLAANVNAITFNDGANAQFYQTTAGGTTAPMIFLGNNTLGSGNGVAATLSSNVTLMGNVTLEAVANGIPSLTANDPLTVAGSISESGGSYSVTKAGVSTVTLAAANTYSGGTTILGGELDIGATGSIGSANVSVASGATLTVVAGGNIAAVTDLTNNGTVNFNNAARTIATLNGTTAAAAVNLNTTNLTISGGGSYAGAINDGGTVGALTVNGPLSVGSFNVGAVNANADIQINGTSKAAALNLLGSFGAWTSGFDVTTSKFILESTPASMATALAQIQDQVNFGRTHTAGIFSSTLPANYGIAVLDNSVTNFATFGGVSVDSSSILVGAELLGDANADGTVNAADLATVLNNFGSATSAWTGGNFDGATTIDLTDLADVLNNFGQSNPNASNGSAGSVKIAIPAPEPASLALLGLGAAALLGRRRRV